MTCAVTCATCTYGRVSSDGLIECRRHAPSATAESFGLPVRGQHPQACWPRVTESDWCGDYRSKRPMCTPDPFDDPLA